MFWLSRLNEHSSYVGGLLGPMLVIALGVGMLFVPISLVGLTKVAETTPGWRQPAQRRSAGRRVDRAGGARHRRWSAVANSMRSQAALPRARRART